MNRVGIARRSTAVTRVAARADRSTVVLVGAFAAAALASTMSLGARLYGISATDPLTFAAVPLLFVIVAVLASYAPALRATRANPVRALRAD